MCWFFYAILACAPMPMQCRQMFRVFVVQPWTAGLRQFICYLWSHSWITGVNREIRTQGDDNTFQICLPGAIVESGNVNRSGRRPSVEASVSAARLRDEGDGFRRVFVFRRCLNTGGRYKPSAKRLESLDDKFQTVETDARESRVGDFVAWDHTAWQEEEHVWIRE